MGRCQYVVTIEVSPNAEAAWDEWHTGHHIPEILKQPGFLSARKFKDTQFAMGRWSRYVVNYELESVDAFERYNLSQDAHRIRQAQIEKFGLETRVTRQALLEVTPLMVAAGRGPPSGSSPKKSPAPGKAPAPTKQPARKKAARPAAKRAKPAKRAKK